MTSSTFKYPAMVWNHICRWLTADSIFNSSIMTIGAILSGCFIYIVARLFTNISFATRTLHNWEAIIPFIVILIGSYASMVLLEKWCKIQKSVSFKYLTSAGILYVLCKNGLFIDIPVTLCFLAFCVITMLGLNMFGRYFSMLQVLVRLIVLAVLACLICAISIQLGTCSDAAPMAVKLTSPLGNQLLALLPEVMQKFSCNALPNVMGSIIVALMFAFAVLYPVSQRASDLTEFHGKTVVELNSLSQSLRGAAIHYTVNAPINFDAFSKLGIYLFLIFGAVIYATIPFGPVASAKVLSLIVLYMTWLGCELFIIYAETASPRQSTPLRHALHLLLSSRIKESSNAVYLTIESEAKLEEVTNVLSEHMRTTGTVVKAEGRRRHLPLLLGFDYDDTHKQLAVYPLTATFELPRELMIEFKTLLTKRLTALKSNSHANKLELHALFREAVYADTLSLLPLYFEEENTQLAIAAYLTICAEHITKRIMPGWITIVTHLPELSVTTGSLLKHLYVSNLDWPFIAEADIDVSGLFDTDLNKSLGMPEKVTCIMAEPDIKS